MWGIILYSVIFFTVAFILTGILVPGIRNFVIAKGLTDAPNGRSSHKSSTPTLGGTSFFLVLVISLYFLNLLKPTFDGMFLVPPLVILFIVGVKDDLQAVRPLTKLMAQILAVSFVLFNPAFTVTSLNGFLGIYEIPYAVYIAGGIFIMVLIINAYNMIDGIDGLAGMLGIIILGILSALFFWVKQLYLALLAITLIGSIIAFLYYNLSHKKKIFMGDTGSLIIGFVIATLSIKFLAINPNDFAVLPFSSHNAPLILISILIVPLLDTSRVFVLRILQKKSPFSADRKHIHHLLIDYLYYSHRKASIVISVFNLLFIMVMIGLSIVIDEWWLLLITFLFAALACYVLYIINRSIASLKKRVKWRKLVKKYTTFW